MISWLFNWDQVITYFSATSTMKFNTAWCFVLSAAAILYRRHDYFSLFLTTLSFIISFYTVLEWEFDGIPLIDNLWVEDILSVKHLGRMSTFTALNFVLINISWLFLWRNKLKVVAQVLLLIVFIISLLVLISFLLNSPLGNSIQLIDTLSFETSFNFLILTVVIFSLSDRVGLARVFLGDLEGSVAFRKMIVPVVFIPVVLSFIFLNLTEKYNTSTGETLVLYTVVISTIGIITALSVAWILNKNNLASKRLIKQVGDSQAKLTTYKEALDKSAMVILVNKDGVVQEVNEKFQQVTGVSQAEAQGDKLRYLIPSGGDDHTFFTDAWNEAYSNTIWEGERRNKIKSGKYIWTHNFIVPFKGVDDKVEQYLIIKQDITERKEHELERREDYIQKLEQKNKELEQFTYIASHDLQEPLRTVTGLVNLLKKKYSENIDEVGLKSMDFMVQATSRMKNLIKALLDYSRLGNSLELEKVDLTDLLEVVRRDLSSLLTETNSKLIVHKLPNIKCYKTNVALMFQNLISNSVKFRKDGVDPMIEISARKLKNEWEFTVQDNGIGIKEEHSKKIFTIFQRLHGKEEYEGTGIGLAHCEKIVNQHRGRIWVEQNGKPGTCFKFTLSTLTHLYEKES